MESAAVKNIRPAPPNYTSAPHVHPLMAPQSDRYETTYDSGSLLIRVRGLVDLRLYGLVRHAIDEHGFDLDMIIIDLHGISLMADSGYAALIAIDNYMTQFSLAVLIIEAGTEVRGRVQPLCHRASWHD